MKYLILNGSPRRGNTWTVANLIRDNIKQISPQSTFTEIHLSELNMPFCIGCSLCFRKGHEHCPHHDIVQKTIDAIDESDGVIFANTTFIMQPNALMKNWIDHLCFVLHRPYFFTKKAIVISTTGGVGAKKVVQYLGGTLEAMGFNRCYPLPVSSNSWNCYSPDDKVKNKCRNLAQRFEKDVSSGILHPPSFSCLMTYNLFRGMSLSYSADSKYPTQDGAHWTNPVRAHYPYDKSVRLPLHKRIYGTLFYLLGKFAGKNIVVTYTK